MTEYKIPIFLDESLRTLQNPSISKLWTNFISTIEIDPYQNPEKFNYELNKRLNKYGAKIIYKTEGELASFLVFKDQTKATYFILKYS